jgi:hypothetical protein
MNLDPGWFPLDMDGFLIFVGVGELVVALEGEGEGVVVVLFVEIGVCRVGVREFVALVVGS